ncbi:MAG: hypothetical protein Q4D44_00440 [Eubacteriales bacterium]|nr:hypothetical protein [Eubacteriales bacterium]
MGLQFHETMYGKNFFEHQLPKLTRAIEKLAESKTNQDNMPKHPFPLADEETCRRLLDVMNDEKKAEAFANAFFAEIASDDEKIESVGFHMARAILHNSIEEFLVAVVGWTSKSLLDIADKGSIEPQEVKNDE